MLAREPIKDSLPPTFVAPRTRIILAEDDGELRRAMHDELSRDRYDIVEVGSGLALFDELRRERSAATIPALVVSDIRMPGMSGLQVLKTVRDWGMTMPVVLITAFGDEETLLSARDLGPAVIFSKPFDIDDLRTAIMCILRSGPSLGVVMGTFDGLLATAGAPVDGGDPSIDH